MKTANNGLDLDKNIIKRLLVWSAVVAGVLTIPLLTNAPWTGFDFVFAGAVLMGVATIYELATLHTSSAKLRIYIGILALLYIFLVVGWAATGPD